MQGLKGSRLTGWRKIADAMWREPNDPQIFGAMDVDATALCAVIEAARAAGHRVTPTHVVGRALARALRAVPDFNVRLVAGRAVPRPSVDVFFITSVEGGRDLSGVKIDRADDKPLVAIAAELAERARTLKAGKDAAFRRTKRLSDALPGPALRVALRATAYLTGELGLDLPSLSLAATPFGSAMVTSVGMLGLPVGFAPLSWMYKAPLLVMAGEIVDKPLAVAGRVEVRPVLPISATIDHRYGDGWHISKLLKAFREYLDAPQRFEPALEPARAASPAAPGRPAG